MRSWIAAAALVGLVWSGLPGATCAAQPDAKAEAPAAPAELPKIIAMTEVVAIGPTGKSQRAPYRTDGVEKQVVWEEWGLIATPKDGEEMTLPDGTKKTWRSVKPDTDGWIAGGPETGPLAGGWAWWTVQNEADSPRVMVLEAQGHGMVLVNGEARAGDPYEYGWVKLPVQLKRGENRLLFKIARGRVRARLVEPDRAGVLVTSADPTTPTLGGPLEEWRRHAAVVLMNTRAEPAKGLTITAYGPGESETEPTAQSSQVGEIPALGTKKVGFVLPQLSNELPSADCVVIVRDTAGEEVCRGTVRVSGVPGDGTHKATFVSAIDGSAQYFAYRTAIGWPDDKVEKGLILTLHGASVEATSQAAAYGRKDWAHVVAPTNRRPFGFDWEDWGRLDAVEVLEIARAKMSVDDRRIYLTGHSMGGHGTWSIASLMPERFAAIGPSAGWISFSTYSGAPEWDLSDPVQVEMKKAAASSDTLSRLGALKGLPTYILHGDADDNVPVAQARRMREALAGHENLQYHEQPGAGHWWGNECVDWPAMMDFFKAQKKPVEAASAEPSKAWRLTGFKSAFTNRFIMVYGTSGMPDDNEWNAAKARYDAESWWYRGNGSCEIMSDAEFLAAERAAPEGWKDRSVVLYGHSESNSAWATLLKGSPVWGTRRGIEIGNNLFAAPDSAVLFVRPRPGAGAGSGAVVGVVCPTGPESRKFLWAATYFSSGVHYPDVTVLSPEMLENGVGGIRAAGWWNAEGAFDPGAFVVR